MSTSNIDINENNFQNSQRRPKKLIHCSDGVIEESSSSEDEVDRARSAPDSENNESLVNEVK